MFTSGNNTEAVNLIEETGAGCETNTRKRGYGKSNPKAVFMFQEAFSSNTCWCLLHPSQCF